MTSEGPTQTARQQRSVLDVKEAELGDLFPWPKMLSCPPPNPARLSKPNSDPTLRRALSPPPALSDLFRSEASVVASSPSH